jgi:hypothetical protein
MDVLIKLVIISFDPAKREYKVLLAQDNIKGDCVIPCSWLTVNEEGCLYVCTKIFENFIDSSGDWLSYKYVDNYKTSPTELEIIYTVLIPECVKNKKGNWCDVFKGDLDVKTRGYIQQAIRKV